MRIFHVAADRFVELPAMPDALPATGFLWLGSARREFEVGIGDVQAVIHDVLRHRLILTFEAEADGITKDSLIDELVTLVPVS